MKAAIYQKRKKTISFLYQDVVKPEPKDNEVLIKVYAVALNAADYRSMQMGLIPMHKIFGADVAGVIEKVGINCHLFKPGDQVFGDLSTNFGGLAEYVIGIEKNIILKPNTLSFEEASAIPMAAITALQALRNKGKIKANQDVLIYGSGGGVGTFAIQLANYYKASVTAVCSVNNSIQSKSLGAKHIINYETYNFQKHPLRYDLILAINGKQNLRTYRHLLKRKGTLVVVGGAFSQLIKTMFFGIFLSMFGKKVTLINSKPNKEDLAFVTDLVIKGYVKPIIESTFSLPETQQAFNHITKGHAKGKTVIRVVNP